MPITADYLLGRRFVFPGGEAHDITIVAVDPAAGSCRAHALDGGRATLALADVIMALDTGAIVESETGAPFVFETVHDVIVNAPKFIVARRYGRSVSIPAEEYR